jgi:Uma2 family endonuclease
MTHNPPHDWMVSRLTRILLGSVGEAWVVRTQCAVNTADSEPEPDIAIVYGPDDRYLEQHPRADDVAVVIEISDTSVRKDRAKSAIYAAAGIPEYWLINLVNEQVEVHRDPQPAQRVYASRSVLSSTDAVRLQLGETIVIDTVVSQLLPPSV